MANYEKFDDPIKRVSTSQEKVFEAAPFKALRGAFMSLMNRVLGGTAGTGYVPVLAGCGTGSTGGIQITNQLGAIINGRVGTIYAQDNIEMPAGTQAAATVVKYLISGAFGTAGTVTRGNEGTDATSAHLPNLPTGHVALGYVQYTANGTVAWVTTNKPLTGHAAASSGTAAFVDLMHMPYSDEP